VNSRVFLLVLALVLSTSAQEATHTPIAVASGMSKLLPTGGSSVEISTPVAPQPDVIEMPPMSAPAAAAQSSLAYVCDSTVINASSAACTTLNTTIAALYTNTFQDVNARIYVKLGATTLGQSSYVLNLATYTSFRAALITDKTDADDSAATSTLPASNPLNTGMVGLTNANARALPSLGVNPNTGFLSDGNTFCTIGTTGCYDGVITVSSADASSGKLYFRSGSIAGGQFDFYTVVEHETDEILGTASCSFPRCSFSGTEGIAPPDLFRYQSNGTRSFAAGNDNSCNSNTTGNACFSIDGVHMLQQYNNLSNGGDAGDWAGTCGNVLVQDAALCAGVANVDISPAAEIRVLDVIGYTLVGFRPSEPGIFRSGFFWLQDVDGNHQWNTPPDKSFAFGGILGDIPITGDWNGDGKTKVGVYRSLNGTFILGDENGNILFVRNLGVGTQAGDVPVVGDWNGDGRTKVGLFRQGFFWILDYNGDGVFTAQADKTFAFGGIAGDIPVVGDWNGSRTSKIGLFRQGFYWILDTNGNGTIDNVNQVGGDQAFAFGGIQGDVPVVGDWNGSGSTKVGIFRSGFFWVLDANGNHQFDGTAQGQDFAFALGGIAGDTPVVGEW
jgi:hypothetical protein